MSKELNKRFQVWFIPTEEGTKTFGWQRKLDSSFDNADDASMAAWELNADDPAPDKHEYWKYKVIDILDEQNA